VIAEYHAYSLLLEDVVPSVGKMGRISERKPFKAYIEY
jgi:hypothetical protein